MKVMQVLVLLLLVSQAIFSKNITRFQTVSDTSPKISKPDEDFWNRVPVSYDWMLEAINSQTCSSNQKSYYGCVTATQAFASVLKLNLEVIPLDQIKNQKIYFRAERLALIETVPQSISTPKEAFSYFENARSSLLTRFYSAGLSFVSKPNNDFEKILAEVYQRANRNVKKAYYAETIAKFLETAKDPHTSLRPTKQMEEESQAGEKTFVGVGIEFVKFEQGLMVKRVVKNSGAMNAGVQVGDVILKVNDIVLSNLSEDEIKSLIRGPVNSSVKFSIKRENNLFDLNITRAQVAETVVNFEEYQFANKKIAYIRLTHFMYLKACDEIKSLIQKSEKQGVDGYILDLRSNPGGNVSIAACIGGMFLGGQKTLTYFEKKTPSQSEYNPILTNTEQETEKPLVVMINAYSASASEIIAGAFKDYNRAYIVGQTSFGKGSYQGCNKVPNQEELTMCMTGGLFFLPSGLTNQTVGVAPHVDVFVNQSASDSEKYALREAQMYLFPLESKRMPQATPGNWNKLNAPQTCLNNSNLSELYKNANSKDAYFKDFQMLNALATLNCVN